jgi:hypothetical protein
VVDARPDYQGGDAAAKLEEAKRRWKLQALYAQALDHLEAGRWQEAIQGFESVVDMDPEYSDPAHGNAAALLVKARQEREREELPPPPARSPRGPADLPEQVRPRPRPTDRPE